MLGRNEALALSWRVPGVLDDYAFAVIACLDAYEATADSELLPFARSIGEAMVAGFFDRAAGGFCDTPAGRAERKPTLGILGTRRKPFQDSPTPAGNSAAAIALLRLHGYAGDASITMRRIARRPSRRWRSTPGSRDSTAFLRRLMDWRWSASCSRTAGGGRRKR
jgi:uncharacterized protein YyaL (SSP411 family)